MNYLEPIELLELADSISHNIGYSSSIRKVFFSDTNSKFKRFLVTDNSENIQLDLDLMRLNTTEPLIDGSVPFLSWLFQASRYGREFPSTNDLLQKAVAKVEEKTGKKGNVTTANPPRPGIINTIIKQKIIHQDDMLSYAWLEAGVKAGVSIARIQVTRFDQGNRSKRQDGSPIVYSGTGWLLTKDLIITNYHVIEARNEKESDASQEDFNLQGQASIIEFDFNSDNVAPLAVASKGVVAADPALDYCIIRLIKPVDRLPPERFPHLIHSTPNQVQVVNIIQHPFGHAKKVAIRNNHLFETMPPLVRYFTDTEKGSSGSPVFNDRWQVIALHRASQLVKNIEYQGKTVGWVNEGVMLIEIFNHLDKHYPAIASELNNN